MYGLKDNTVKMILDIFKKHSEIKKVVIYGSRAKDTYKNGSDIDLTVFGDNITLTTINKISNELDDLLLPYTFDISIYEKIDNSDLIEHINRVGKVFYSNY